MFLVDHLFCFILIYYHFLLVENKVKKKIKNIKKKRKRNPKKEKGDPYGVKIKLKKNEKGGGKEKKIINKSKWKNKWKKREKKIINKSKWKNKREKNNK